MSLTFVCSFLVVDSNFEKLKATAMALAVCGSGFGCFIFPPILESIYASYGYEACLIFLAASSSLLLLNVIFYRRPGESILTPLSCPCGRKRSPVTQPLLASSQGSETDNSDIAALDDRDLYKLTRSLSTGSARLTLGSEEEDTHGFIFWDWTLLKDAGILALLLQNLTIQAVLAFCAQFTPAYAIDQGIDPLKASLLLSASGISSSLGPLVISRLMDIKTCRPHILTITNAVVAVGAILHIVTPCAKQYAGKTGHSRIVWFLCKSALFQGISIGTRFLAGSRQYT